MEICRVKLPKQKLAAMPVEERTALLLMGHVMNEINVLQKLMLSPRKKDTPSRIVNLVEEGQVLILMRIVIGKLHEAWKLFKLRVQANEKMRTGYLNNLAPDAKQALENLRQHFDEKSVLTDIRDRLSFHYTDKDGLVEKNFQRLPENEPWEFYLGEPIGNTFYYASELVVTASAIRLANPDDDAAGAAKMRETTIEVSRNIGCLFHELIADIVERAIPDLERENVDIGDVQKRSTFSFDFFIDEDKGRPHSRIKP